MTDLAATSGRGSRQARQESAELSEARARPLTLRDQSTRFAADDEQARWVRDDRHGDRGAEALGTGRVVVLVGDRHVSCGAVVQAYGVTYD